MEQPKYRWWQCLIELLQNVITGLILISPILMLWLI